MKTILAVCLFAGLSMGAAAQHEYPVKPIRWIVVSPPGSPPDFIGRMIGTKLTEAWGQPVVLDFRPGGGMVIGTEIAARAARAKIKID